MALVYAGQVTGPRQPELFELLRPSVCRTPRPKPDRSEIRADRRSERSDSWFNGLLHHANVVTSDGDPSPWREAKTRTTTRRKNPN